MYAFLSKMLEKYYYLSQDYQHVFYALICQFSFCFQYCWPQFTSILFLIPSFFLLVRMAWLFWYLAFTPFTPIVIYIASDVFMENRSFHSLHTHTHTYTHTHTHVYIYIYIYIYIYRERGGGVILNKLQGLICHKTQPTNQPTNQLTRISSRNHMNHSWAPKKWEEMKTDSLFVDIAVFIYSFI